MTCLPTRRLQRRYERVPHCLVIVAVLGALAAGCARQQPASPATPTTTLPAFAAAPPSPTPSATTALTSSLRGSVSVWTAWEAANVSELSNQLQEFHQRHPTIQVRLTYFRESELQEAFQSGVASGTGPTVLIGPSAWGPSLLREGLIADVSQRLSADQREALPERVWSQASSGAALLGVPVRLRGVVLYRNASLAPQPAATLQDLLDQSAAVAARYPAEPVFDLGFEVSGAQLTACGGTLLRAAGGLAFDEATGVCWLSLLARFREVGRPVYDSDADRATFIAGHSPWLIDTTDSLPVLVDALGADHLAIDRWPVASEGERRLSGYVQTDNAYLVAGGLQADLEASWALISLLVTPEEQARHAQAKGSWFLPVLEEVAPREPLAADAQAILFDNTAMPLATDLSVYAVPLERAVVSVVSQAGDPVEALRRATEIITNQLTQSPPGG